MLIIPTMRTLLYDRSIVWMRMLLPYKREEITAFMQVLSVIGDGTVLLSLCIVSGFGLGRTYDYVYLTTVFFVTYHWSHFFKSALRDSRPQFDDPSLANSNVGDCAGEFGNPSGHSLVISGYFLVYVLFYKEVFAEFF